ncbi:MULTISPECIES: glycosyltransferase family 4 protein [unclassified Streptomyces]|uniref:glycosyltransferase family 4 protein n=1 Tax=unclassified Streptomyces TaxID=2593676 RepID=UPI00136A7DDD|nr:MULTISPECIES: glycosyltransferase family 4 protein [unclassified Streptomyces]MYY87090.1 glycosyltransferase [Streptomyces sp. SID335]MYZ18116.1 glycosyltransferase [Streptomyces sp. SID337]NDZ89489.1 glycosyltransferase family 4 protein [Streptomyces sp. SID10115]NEA05107.1 glycosyltransferase family 4 protein [Streptomyces sp. SID10116]
MRILATVSDQAWGGKHRYMYDVLSGLSALGHQVGVHAEQGGRMAARCRAAGALDVVEVPPFTSAAGPADAVVAQTVRRDPPDVLIASGRRDLMAVHRARVSLGLTQPFVFFRHSAFPLSEQESAPDVLAGLTRIVGTSRQQIEQQFMPLVAAGTIPEARLVLIPSGVSATWGQRVAGHDEREVRRRLGIGADLSVFLVPARLSWEKDIGRAIEAFAALPVEDAVLLIAGEGPDHGALRDQARASGAGERILFLGHVDAVDELLSVAGAVVLTSSVPETGPLALKEAMAAGVPVIAPALGGIPEFVRHERDGLLYEPGRTESLSALMLRLYEQEDLGGILGRAAARTIRTAHRLERRVEHLAWLLDLLVLRTDPGTALSELRWNAVRLRDEARFTYLFVPGTSQITELPPAAAETVGEAVAHEQPALLARLDDPLRGEIVTTLYRMGALGRVVTAGAV